MRNTFFLFTLLFLSACNNVDQELNQVKALQDQLTKSEQVFQAWNLEHMTQRKKDVESLLDSVSNYYTNKNLVMDLPVGLLMADFKATAKSYKRVYGDYSRVKEELEYSKTQLFNLSRDLESGAMEKDSALRYISEEAIAVKSLYEQVYKLDTMFMQSERMYAERLPKVDSLISTFQ